MTATIDKLKTYSISTKAYIMLFKHIIIVLLSASIGLNTYGVPSKFRLTGIGDLSTEMTIIFDTSFNGNYTTETHPKVYYGTSYKQVNNLSSAFVEPSSVNTNSQMRNNICRLNNLTPNTTYYFKVTDANGNSEVYHFETLPDDNSPLSIITGGDSRNNRSVRVAANKMVAKLKPHAILFTGDFTDTGAPQEWRWWFEDWQYTIDSENRIVPIIPTRGNHEANDNYLVELFGTPENVYYTSSNKSLLTVVTLNSEKAINSYGAQTTWLLNTLPQINTTYKIAQYHKPMRSHIKSYSHGSAQYAYWAKTLEDYQVDIVVESNSHTSKTTWPIAVCTGGFNCDEGFKRDDQNGIVYTGEGGWGSPLRMNDNDKIWTRTSGMYNQFKLLFIDEYGVELRTVLVDNESQVTEVNINDRFNLPANENIWTTGEVVYVQNKNNNTFPTANLVYPTDNTIFYNLEPVLLEANASDSNGNIEKISFYVNGSLVHEDFTYPYEHEIHPVRYGQYVVHIIATDNDGLTSCMDMAVLSFRFGNSFSSWAKVNTTTDDAEEYSNGYMDLFNWDVDLGYKDYTCGFRFTNLNIPPNAIVTKSYIQFTADEDRKFEPANFVIAGERNPESKTFFINANDISNRIKTTERVSWNVEPWDQVGASEHDQRTPDLSKIMNEIIALPNYTFESPLVFIIEGEGHRAVETFDGDSAKAPILYFSYVIGDELVNEVIEVWPGDADNNGVISSKDILYICINYENIGPKRVNATMDWVPQPVVSWNRFIDGVNFAHQDADGNGCVDLNDINVVATNYGKQTSVNDSFFNYPTKSLKLEQTTANGKSTEYKLFLQADQPVMAHGIHGSIDLSDFLKSNRDMVNAHTTLENIFGGDVLFTKFHQDTKILDFAISRTDQQNWQINDISLMRIVIVVEDIIEGGYEKKAEINSSGIVSSEGNYENLNESTFYVYQEKMFPVNRELSNLNINLITTKVNCKQSGTAEVQIFNDTLSEYVFEWSNGMSGYKVDGLEEGNYTLTIKKDNNHLKSVQFEIESRSSISETIFIDEAFTKNTTVVASKEISVGNGVELTGKYTVELLIEDCNSN